MIHTHFVSVHHTTCLFTILYHDVNCKLHTTSPYVPSPSLCVSRAQNFSYFLDRKFTIFNRYLTSPQFPCFLSFLTTSLLPIISPSFLVSFPPFLAPSLAFFRSANSYNIFALPQLFMTSFINLWHKVFSHFANTSSHTWKHSDYLRNNTTFFQSC